MAGRRLGELKDNHNRHDLRETAKGDNNPDEMAFPYEGLSDTAFDDSTLFLASVVTCSGLPRFLGQVCNGMPSPHEDHFFSAQHYGDDLFSRIR